MADKAKRKTSSKDKIWHWNGDELEWQNAKGKSRPKPERGSPDFKVIEDIRLVKWWMRSKTFNTVAKRFWWYSPQTLRQRVSDIRTGMRNAGISKEEIAKRLPALRHVKKRKKIEKDADYYKTLLL